MAESMSMLEIIKQEFATDGGDLRSYSPLSYAYIGDSIYALIVKSVMTLKGNVAANVLNKRTVDYVKASAQARIAQYFGSSALLTEDEADMLRRGRNAKSPSIAKHASVQDYRLATGLEALMGYLYMKNEHERLVQLMKLGMDYIDGNGC